MDWKDIEIKHVVKIERLVDEFEVWELDKIPYGKFKVKIFETVNGQYIGRTNLMVKDKTDDFCAGVGYGSTIEDALKDTILYFYSMIDELEEVSEELFAYVDVMDF